VSFGWSELFAGNRFWAPVSEAALLEAGRAAGLSGGMTLVEASCGNGAVSVFFAEEFHVYARGVEADPVFLEDAKTLAGRSPAHNRVRFFMDDVVGPVDLHLSLRRPSAAPPGCARMLIGRFRADEAALAGEFPVALADPPGQVAWVRAATPLEWERYYAPQERALRRYKRSLKRGEALSPVALAAERQISAFRSNGAQVRYELMVVEAS
jgi:hypothetical protein